METKDFLCACLGVCSWKVDEITDKFDIDIVENDVYDLLDSGIEYSRFGDALISDLYLQIIERAVEELGLDEDKFNYYANGMCSDLSYDGEDVYAWEDLEEIAEKVNE